MVANEELSILRERILVPIANSHAKLPADLLGVMLALKGALYNQELMVVGRALNGWDRAERPASLVSTAELDRFVQLVASSRQEACPLQWVSDHWGPGKEYNLRKSAFWRVIRRAIHELNIPNVEESNWPSHLVWSNLYKVAPAAGSNPNTKLGRLQRQGCIELLHLELKTYRPRRVFFLTGKDWAKEFLDDLTVLDHENLAFRRVERFGTIRIPGQCDIHFVVAARPERKLEDPFVNEVVQAFRQTAEVL